MHLFDKNKSCNKIPYMLHLHFHHLTLAIIIYQWFKQNSKVAKVKRASFQILFETSLRDSFMLRGIKRMRNCQVDDFSIFVSLSEPSFTVENRTHLKHVLIKKPPRCNERFWSWIESHSILKPQCQNGKSFGVVFLCSKCRMRCSRINAVTRNRNNCWNL